MMDGDVCHSSEIKLPAFRTVVVPDLFSLWFFPLAFLSRYFNIMFCV
jgi:hypothetical protein